MAGHRSGIAACSLRKGRSDWLITLTLAVGCAVSTAIGAPEIEPPATVTEVPAGALIERHYYDPGSGEHRLRAGDRGGENLVYSNTPSPDVFLALPPNIRIADDILTVAIDGCSINGFEIGVAGGGDGSGPGFTVDFAIYDGCPNGGGEPIPGTQGSVATDHDGLHFIFVDLSSSPVSTGNRFWIGASFDRQEPGWIFGRHADTGYTDNVYDMVYSPCAARFSGTDLYAGFHARVWCEPPFETEYLVYANTELDGDVWVLPAGFWWADDFELVVSDCVLSSFEFGVVGTGGGITVVTTELFHTCGSGAAIPGTRSTATFVADGTPSFVRFDFPGGIDLGGGAEFWLAYSFDRDAGTPLAGEAELGYTGEYYGVVIDETDECLVSSLPGYYVGMAVTVRCLGSSPLGACCDRTDSNVPACGETTAPSCIGPHKSWVQGASCNAADPAGPPCDLAACCTPPSAPMGEVCLDLARSVCEAIVDDQGNPGVWQAPSFCGDPEQGCVRWACQYATGACELPNGTPGCSSPDCCELVCGQDPYCCEVEWDSICIEWVVAPMGCRDLDLSYDDCHDPDPLRGALSLNHCAVTGERCETDGDCQAGDTCAANGATDLWNGTATTEETEAFCCHPDGPALPATGGVWAKFTATHTSARVDTCLTGDPAATDSLIQVFRALDHSTDEAACNSLVPIGCIDDGGCAAGQAAVCLHDLTIGETYYVLLASASPETHGLYRLTLESPAPPLCPDPGGQPTCPAGTVDWLDPPDGVVDARQPHDANHAGRLSGIDRLHVRAPIEADPTCWTLCDEVGTNAIASVEPHRDCTSTLRFDRPITAGAVTRVVYSGTGAMASLTAHPGNADADVATDPGDIISLIDMLNEVHQPPWGLYSCDMDHSGICDPSDIIMLIDLLNGASAFEPWFGTPLPAATGDCP